MTPSIAEPRGQEARVYRFDPRDEGGRSIDTFTSRRGGWRVGDWVLTGGRRRVQIVGMLPAPSGAAPDIHQIWLVEPA